MAALGSAALKPDPHSLPSCGGRKAGVEAGLVLSKELWAGIASWVSMPTNTSHCLFLIPALPALPVGVSLELRISVLQA